MKDKHLCTKCKQEVEPILVYHGSELYSWFTYDEEAEFTEERPDYSECCHAKVITWYVDSEDNPLES